MKICFIGYGNMARAIAQHLVKLPNYTIFASSPSLDNAKTSEGIQTSSDNLAVLPNSNLVILAVKPNQAEHVLKQIGPALPAGSVLISTVTGLNLAYLATHCCANQAIIRSMPNLPIAIGKGATPLIANQSVSSQQKNQVQELFDCAGITAWLNKESDIDCMTALSGSGPAYLFYFLEAMINAGKKLGLDETIIKPFVLQTVTGAIEMASASDIEPTELRKKVTSAKGTTAAAIDVLQQHGFEKLIFGAINAAHERAKQLGNY